MTPLHQADTDRAECYAPRRNGHAKQNVVGRRELENLLIKMFALARREVVDELLPPLIARLEALEARPQTTTGVKWAGIWSAGQKYLEGSLCTHAGGLWLCRRESYTRPGGNDDWVLIVKSGRAES